MTESSPLAGKVLGFVGLGKMGAPMAARLLAHGAQVIGYDVSAAAREALDGKGGTSADSLAAVGESADVLILMLPNSDLVEKVATDPLLLAALDKGSLMIDMSSSEPLRTRQLAARLENEGIGLIDAPVSGGVVGAENGTLTIMVGGEERLLDRARPYLEALGGRVEHVGGLGAGHAVKALNNLMSASHLLASSEALILAERFGLDIDVVLGVVNASSGRSGSTEVKWPKYIVPGTYDSGFALQLMLKDMRIAIALADELGSPMPLTQRATELWADAGAALDSGADHTEVARWLGSSSAAAVSEGPAE